MQVAMTQPGSLWDAPAPVLLNTWKHHAAALRERIVAAVDSGDLQALADGMVVIGTELMDLYLGALSPAEIGRQVVDQLTAENRLALDAYRTWIQAGNGYRLLDLSDGCRWVLRLGDETDRYVHVHPGRYAAHTRRVRANVLKTAVMVLAHTGLHGGAAQDRTLVNAVRQRYLALAPIGRDLKGDQGLGAVIDLLHASR
jgi:hypothetical protein